MSICSATQVGEMTRGRIDTETKGVKSELVQKSDDKLKHLQGEAKASEESPAAAAALIK